MMVMEEPDEGLSGEIESAFIGGCRPATESGAGEEVTSSVLGVPLGQNREHALTWRQS